MLQGRQIGELCPAPAMASQQQVVAQTMTEIEHPQDLARQALAATGGKSNLKATKWLLERRAEVVQHHYLDVDDIAAQGHPRKTTEGASAASVRAENEDMAVHLPSSPSFWCNNNMTLHGAAPALSAYACAPRADGSTSPVSAFVGVPRPDGSALNRANSLPNSKDWITSSSALERHASVGSCAPLCREEVAEARLQLKLQPALEQQETIKSVRVTRSPEPEDVGKVNMPKSAAVRPVAATAVSHQEPAAAASLKRKRQEEIDSSAKPLSLLTTPSSPISVGIKQHGQPIGKTPASLAERMRPNSISEILGQDHLLGPHCVLRSLLDGEYLPCIIFGGSPGTGKTSLARLIARSASCRFVSFHSAKSGNFEIQEILEEAKQARKFGQRTVLFVETLSRFTKSHQECLLPAIEAGFVVFIGATTENPSSELISSLLLRCRTFTLRKLQHDHLCCAMKRAISDHERGVQVTLGDIPGIEVLAIEDEVIHFLASSADGDARVALNALEASVCIALGKMKQKKKLDFDGKLSAMIEMDDVPHKEKDRPISNAAVSKRETTQNVLEHLKGHFQFSQEEYAKPFKKVVGGKEVTYGLGRDKECPKLSCDDIEGASTGSTMKRDGMGADYAERNVGSGTYLDIETTLVVTMQDAKEAFKCPQTFIEKICEESNSDVMTAMLKSMKGGDGNAAVYWLARLLEKGEEPLRIASVLLRFSSEEIGMADPQALLQAVACQQACQVMEVKECSSYLTQCVVYLSFAPKSDTMPQAFQSAFKVIQETPIEPVPVHLRASFRGLTKDVSYLPASLRNVTFLRWPIPK